MNAFTKIKISKLLTRHTPPLIKMVMRSVGLTNLYNSTFLNKYESELATKVDFGKEFEKQGIKDKALEYYNTFRFLPEIKSIIAPTHSSKILDVGCGIASVLHFLDGEEKHGIDPLADYYKKIYNYPDDILLKTGIGENLPYPNSYFDVVFCTNVLDHVSEPKKVVNEMSRVLKGGGYLALIVDIHEDDRAKPRSPHHPHNLTEKGVLSLLEDLFKIIFRKETKFLGIKQYVLGGETIEIHGNGKQLKDYIFVEDFCDGLIHAALDTRTCGDVLNIGYGEGISLHDAAKIIVDAVGHGRIKKVSIPTDYKNMEAGGFISDISQIKKTGWRPVTTFSSGVKKTIDMQTDDSKDPKSILLTGNDA